ncbi:MAG: DNA-directed RNA polymerase subunit alpha [Synergistaceae bacterium]|nr:DNA-directed RNA polymerase subunit alpha [Synergistaceae bacterium]
MENTRFKVYIEEKKQDYGLLYLEPLERGYGDTLGNALRRLLLSSIRGAAVTAVKIVGVLHEFSTIKGIREDVIEILMNLKHIPIRTKQDLPPEEHYKIITLDSDVLPEDFFTRAENPGVITAKDMPWDINFEFFGDGILCTLEPGAHLLMEIYVEQGVGYLSAERERPAVPPLPIDAMLADAIFSPVKRVNYEIEPARVGQSIDYERLILEVWTNGAVTPENAVKEAARIAEDYFKEIADTVDDAPQVQRVIEVLPEPPVQPEPSSTNNGAEASEDPEWFSHPIHELELTIRSENCLLRGGMNTIGDLIKKSRDDLLKIRNLGKKSLGEIEAKLASMGYALKPGKPGSKSEADSLDDDSDSEYEHEYDDIDTDNEAKAEIKTRDAEIMKGLEELKSLIDVQKVEAPAPESESETEAKTKAKKPKKAAKPKTPKAEAESELESETETKAKTKTKSKATAAKTKTSRKSKETE